MSTFQRAPFVVFCLVAVLCGGVMIGTQQTPGTGSDRGGMSAGAAVGSGGGSSSSATPTAAATRDTDVVPASIKPPSRRIHRGRTVTREVPSAPGSSSAGPGAPAGGSLPVVSPDLPSVQPAQEPSQLQDVLSPGNGTTPAPATTPARPTRGPEPSDTPPQGGSQTSDPPGTENGSGGGSQWPTTDLGSADPTPSGTPSSTPSGTPSPSNSVNPSGTPSPSPSIVPDPTTTPQPVAPEPTAPSAPQPVVPEPTAPADPEPAPDEDDAGPATLSVGSDATSPEAVARVA